VSNNKESESTQVFKDRLCTKNTRWNAWECKPNFGLLIIDSLDADRLDRNVAPVHIKNPDLCNNDGECFDNRLNSLMDNCWDGFYGCQTREQRYISMVYNHADYYEVYYTGTPPENQHFRIWGDHTGFMIRIVYSNSNSYSVNVDGQPKPQQAWNDALSTYEPLTSNSKCGDNRYLGTQNILEFFIKPDCHVKIRPMNSIQLGVRLDFSFDTFFEQGGVTSFIDNMAAVLGVHKADLKVVSVYEGSIIIDFEILENLTAAIPIVLADVQATFVTAATVMDTFMGAPLLGAISAAAVVVTPNTPVNEDGSILEEFVNIWARKNDPDPTQPVWEDEADVEIEVRYEVKSINASESRRESGRVAFAAILACVLVIAVLIVAAVILLRKISDDEPKDKGYVPEAILERDDFADVNIFEEQYSPHKRGDSFGGVSFGFDRTSTAKMNSKLTSDSKLLDDSIKTISGLKAMNYARENK